MMMQSSAHAILTAEGKLEVGNSTGDLGTGEFSICRAILKTCSPTLRQAFITAVPDEAAVHEPPARGDPQGRRRPEG
jgi:xanthine dehydrogenase YagR molybdenum-binding subunit